MKLRLINHWIIGAALCCAAPAASAADCQLDVTVLPCEQTENVPDIVNEQLAQRLQTMMAESGIVADGLTTRFFVTGRFSHILEEVVPGPPKQDAIHTTLTLYIGDAVGKTVFASKSFELRGVGTSSQRAYINALKGLNRKNDDFTLFLNKGKEKIIAYYDENYETILKQAETAVKQRGFEEALYLLSAVPPCCVGYDKVSRKIISVYDMYMENLGQQLLMKAKAEWAANPTAEGAAAAFAYLEGIDIYTSAYKEALKLAAEMKASVRSDYEFETRTKYEDEISLERDRIEMARQVGVAFGNGQQPSTTNITWLN